MIQPSQPTSGTNSAGAAAILSGAIKSVLIALVSIHVLPWDGQQTTAIALAFAGVIDVVIYMGWVRPGLAQQLTAAANAVPPGAVPLPPPQVTVTTTIPEPVSPPEPPDLPPTAEHIPEHQLPPERTQGYGYPPTRVDPLPPDYPPADYQHRDYT